MNLNFIKNCLFFWQPQTDWFKKVSSVKYGGRFLVVLNYLIWVYLFYVSYLLIKQDTNIFWQLFIATILSEVIEKVLKIKSFWKRPMYIRKNNIPDGLFKSWYQKGSFPSGHAIKATFFLFFVIQHPISLSPETYISIAAPLIFVRIFIGLHYPIDVIGGFLIGILIYLFTHLLVFPSFLVNFIRTIFNFVFFIR